MIKLIVENYQFIEEILYVISFIEIRLGCNIKIINNIKSINEEDIIINYGKEIIDNFSCINIKPSKLFSDLYMKMDSLPSEPLKKYKNIPIIYDDGTEIYVSKNHKSINTNIDIIQSIYFMLTRYEEIVLWDKIEKDLYGRFPAKESLAYKEKFLDIPIVDEYIEWFWQWLKAIKYNGKKKKNCGNYDFIACLTHDVDIPFKYKEKLKNQLKSFKTKGSTIEKYENIVKYTLRKIDYNKDPYFTFDYIRKQEKKYGFTSSFYFMNGGNSKYENFYDINDGRIKKLIKKLEQDNCEVGYHYSFNSYNNLQMRKKEKDGLNERFTDKNYGGRNHYLRFEPLESWRICEKVGLLYDTTLGYADYDGFRCGTCFPYKPFDVKERRTLDFWEIPLIVMEGTLKDEKYRNLNCEDAFKEIKKRIDTVKKYNGVFTLLWHNSSFDNDEWLGWIKVFEKTMDYLFKNNSIGVSGKNLINLISGENKNNEENINY